MLASLRAAFRQGPSSSSPNADLNAQIASAILSCFPPELFDATGLFRSLWLSRLTSTTCDAQGMIEDLLALDTRRPGGQGGLLPGPSDDRRRRFGGT
jgi:hypothetical protein